MEIGGSRVLITGGCGGIGLAVARAFLGHGLEVILADLGIEAGRELAREHSGVSLVEVDLADAGAIEARLGPLAASETPPDILVNSVGISPKTNAAGERIHIWEISLEDWNRVMATNLTSHFLATRLVLPAMMANRRGRIVNVSSMAARIGAQSGGAFYTTSKAGVLGLTMATAKEVAPFGITVNAVNPGTIATPMIDDVPGEVQAAYVSRVPLGRIGRPEDVAGAVLYLASALADYVTGTAIEVNGGFYMGP